MAFVFQRENWNFEFWNVTQPHSGLHTGGDMSFNSWGQSEDEWTTGGSERWAPNEVQHYPGCEMQWGNMQISSVCLQDMSLSLPARAVGRIFWIMVRKTMQQKMMNDFLSRSVPQKKKCVMHESLRKILQPISICQLPCCFIFWRCIIALKYNI